MELAGVSSICVFGDSIVYAHTDPLRGGWAGRLKAALTEANDAGGVYALGVPGNTVADVAARVPPEASVRHPDIVVLAVGGADSPNDYATATSLHAFGLGYADLIEVARSQAPRVLVVTPPNLDEGRPTFGFTNATLQPDVAAIRSAAAAHSAPFADLFGTLTPEDFDVDGVHPNGRGHRTIYCRILPAMIAL